MLFRIITKPAPPRGAFKPIALLFCLGVAFVAIIQAQTEGGSESSIKGIATTIVAVIGAISLVFGIGWGLLNRKNYDKLKETIEELEESCESKDKRIEELRLTCAATEARINLVIVAQTTTITGLKVSNEAVVSQNLQMKAILKGLRLSGKWEGHEDVIHITES